MIYRITVLAMLAIVSGCTTLGQTALIDFTDDKAEVQVGYIGHFPPKNEDAAAVADPVALEDCESLGKTPTRVSAYPGRGFYGGGTVIVLYRCEGADRVLVE